MHKKIRKCHEKITPLGTLSFIKEGTFEKGLERQRPQQMETGERGHGHMHGNGNTEDAIDCKGTWGWGWKGRTGSYCLKNNTRSLYLIQHTT